MSETVARIFISSTFRDFSEERELLAKRVFPALRQRLRERYVELVDVDLRWGIPQEAAEKGEVLPICLAEIDRSRPWFIGMLGERYGWVPPADQYQASLLEQQPWLEQHRGGKSVTELEILHGVLNDPKMAGRAFFYFREPGYAQRKGGAYVSTSDADAVRLRDLKARIRASSFPVVEDYPTPEALAERLEVDLWSVLDAAYPQSAAPDAFSRDERKHEAYAVPRRRLYLGGERYLRALDAALASSQQRILIGGQSGGGKSALIANWVERCRKACPGDHVHQYYLGASADAGDPVQLARHLLEHIQRTTGSEEPIPSDPQALLDSIPGWLVEASAFASKEGTRWIIALDGLNNLVRGRDLRWLPEFLPDRVHLLVSCLPGEVRDKLDTRGTWQPIDVQPLATREQRQLLRSFLAQYNKTLEASHEAQVLAHPLAANPLFLRTLAEELRLFGRHEDLSEELARYLSSVTVDDLFERVLERVEQDCGAHAVRSALTGIWASRAGLAEEELLGFAGLVPATWAPIRMALDEALLESGGRLTFAHDYLRIAVSDRYMAGNNALEERTQSPEALALRSRAHAKLARWFAKQPADARVAEELPWQWQQARDWKRLRQCLTSRPVLEAFLRHRSSDELLQFWLECELHNGMTLEAAYAAAWRRWKPDSDSPKTATLAIALGKFVQKAGRFRHPLTGKLARQALAIAEKVHGPDDPKTGAALDSLAVFLRATGDLGAARLLHERALALAEAKLGPDHPTTGTRLNQLALLLKMAGEYAAAEPLFRRALAITEQALGADHPAMATRLNNLAQLLRAKGDLEAAKPLYLQSIAVAERAKGADHFDTATALNNLASLLKDLGDFAEAEQYYRRSLAIVEKVRGPRHPITGRSMNNLAVLLRKTAQYAEAEALQREALAITEEGLGPDHSETGARLGNLGGLLRQRGDLAAAEPLLRRALAIAERSQGPNHPGTGAKLNSLASLLRAMGDYVGAEPLARRALAIAEAALGPDHPSTGSCVNDLALISLKQGNLAEAETLFRRAVAVAEKTMGASHPDTGARLNNLAMLLKRNGDLAGAEPLLRRSLAIAEQSQGPDHPATGTKLNNLASLLRSLGDTAGAEQLYRRALAIAEASLGPDHPVIAVRTSNLALVLEDMGDTAGAEPLRRRALAITEKTVGPTHPDTADRLINLARLLMSKGDLAEAESLLLRARSLVGMTTPAPEMVREDGFTDDPTTPSDSDNGDEASSE